MNSLLPTYDVLSVVIGNVTIVGSLTLQPGSTTTIQISGQSASGATVTGCAVLDGVLVIDLQEALTGVLQLNAINSPCLSGNFTGVSVNRGGQADRSRFAPGTSMRNCALLADNS